MKSKEYVGELSTLFETFAPRLLYTVQEVQQNIEGPDDYCDNVLKTGSSVYFHTVISVVSL